MKRLFSLFSMLMLLSSNALPAFTYAEEIDNNTIIELFSNLLNTYGEENICEAGIEYTSGDYKGITTENCGIKITEYNGTSTDIIIPDEMNGYPIKEIGESVFKQKSITTIVIPNSITVIGTGAFQSNRFNSDFIFNFPSNLKIIEAHAFEKSGLSGNNGLPNGLEYIGGYAFSNFGTSVSGKPTHITNLNIPDSVKYIGEYAFNSNPIQELIIGNSVEYIGDYAFQSIDSYYVPSSFDELYIPDSVNFLGFGSFQSNKNLKKVKIGSGTGKLTIMADALSDCKINNLEITKDEIYLLARWHPTNNYWIRSQRGNPYENVSITANKMDSNVEGLRLIDSSDSQHKANLILSGDAFSGNNIDWILHDLKVKNVTLPENQTEILDKAFEYQNDLVSINIPNTVKKIGNRAFGSTYSLKSIDLPEGLKEIATGAFEYSEIPEIIIPDSVEFIGKNAFRRNGKDLYDELGNYIGFEKQKVIVYVTSNIIPEIEDPESVEYVRLYKIYFTGGNELGFNYPTRQLVRYNEKLSDPEIKLPGYELAWYEENSESPFDFVNTAITEDKNLYAHWKSLEEKAQETVKENVVYTNTTTVTVGDESTEETLSGSTTLTLVSKEVESNEVKKEEGTTKVQESEIKVTSDKTVEYEGGLEVYLEKTEDTGTEVKTGKVEGTIKFSAPVAVKIPISSEAEYVKVQVKHGDEDFGYKGLTLNPVNECNNGEAVNDKYSGEDVLVTGNTQKYATIYTCSASTFVAYTESKKPVEPTPSAGGGRTITLIKQETKITEQEHNSADTAEPEVTQASNQSANTPAIEDQVKKIEGRSLTRGEVAIMTNILLEVYPQLVEGKQELDDVTNACSNYADEQNFTKDEKKAITRLCKLSIMGIHNDTNEPLDEFLAKQKSTNGEFATVMDRVVANYNEKDLSTIKEALKKLEGNEENVVFGTVYEVFMGIKNIFSK